MARFTNARKRNEMKSRLESGNDRQQAGVLTELLMSEILYAVSSTLEIEPQISARGARPDFRIWDENENSVTVEVTHFMDSSDQRHRESLAWNSVIHQLRPVVRPIPAMVTIKAIGVPTETHIGKPEKDNFLAGIQRSLRHRRKQEFRLSGALSIRVSARPAPSLAGKDSLASWDYEHPGGLVDVRGKLRRISQIVRTKTTKYSGYTGPLVVAVNCPTTFVWLDQDEELGPLQDLLAGAECDAVWLFENLQPWSLGCASSHLVESPESPHAAEIDPIRRAQAGPLYEVLGLGPVWNRLVGWDR